MRVAKLKELADEFAQTFKSIPEATHTRDAAALHALKAARAMKSIWCEVEASHLHRGLQREYGFDFERAQGYLLRQRRRCGVLLLRATKS